MKRHRGGDLRAVAVLLLLLTGLSACGQMGPLQLPADPAPIGADGNQDDNRDDNER